MAYRAGNRNISARALCRADGALSPLVLLTQHNSIRERRIMENEQPFVLDAEPKHEVSWQTDVTLSVGHD